MARAAALLAIALVAGCAQSPGRRAPTAELDIQVDLLDPAAPRIEGELATFRLTIRNAGQRYLILRDLEEAGAGSVVTWQRPQPGRLTYRAETDEFTYDTTSRDSVERPVFNTSLMAPGEEIVFKPRLRLLNLPRRFTLDYFIFDAAGACDRLYVQRSRTGKSETYGKPANAGELELFLRPDPTEGLVTHRTVIFPFAETISGVPSTRPVVIDATYAKRGFTLDQALSRIGKTRADLKATSFYAATASWAVQVGDDAWWIGSATRSELPSISNIDLFCHAIDSLPVEAAIEFELHVAIAQVFAAEVRDFKAAAIQDGPKRRYLVLVRRVDLDAFLAAVKRLTYRILVSPAPGGWRLLVTH